MTRRDLDVWRPSRRWKDPYPLSPFTSFGNLGSWLDPWTDDLFSPGFSGADLNQSMMTPACDIEETDNQYLVTMDMPGMRKEDIQIDVSGNQLSVSAERTEREKEGTRFRSERYGSFCRSFTLPTGASVEKIEANYRDGVLELAIPKGEGARSRKIMIGEGEPRRAIKGTSGKEARERDKAA